MIGLLRVLTILIVLLNAGVSAAQTNTEQTSAVKWLSEIDMTGYQNKVVYLDFWASWCVPCRLSFPWLNEMQAKYRDKGLVIIAVNLDRDVNKAKRFVKRYPVDFLLYSDPKGLLAQKYKITVMPSSYLFSGAGELTHKHLGFDKSKESNFEANIVSLLDQLAKTGRADE